MPHCRNHNMHGLLFPSLRIDLRNEVDRRKRAAYVFPHMAVQHNFPMLSGGFAVKIKRFIFFFVMAAGLFLLSHPVLAHHSTAEYDMTTLTTVKGTVTEFEWSNPHAYIHIDVTNDKGKAEKWTAELASIGMLSRVGWKKDTAKPGDEITIVGNRAKSGTNYMRLNKIVLASGQELSAEVR
jgi:hypothetical protein